MDTIIASMHTIVKVPAEECTISSINFDLQYENLFQCFFRQ